MVVFVDLDDPDEVEHHRSAFDMGDLIDAHATTTTRAPQLNTEAEKEKDEDAEHPNLNALSAMIGCYPIISSISAHLDLNSLHHLSRTCRQLRAHLLQHRKHLIPRTLHCSSEFLPPAGRLGNLFREANDAWNTHDINGNRVPRLTSGRIGTCARDLVGECRRCGCVVCRNCIMKAPSSTALKSRLRRLCRTCISAPLSSHTKLTLPDSSYTHPLHRSPCTCNTTVWLCSPCGATLRTNDTSYTRAWTWRSRYTTTPSSSALSTGIGQGHEGVQCGRASSCLASHSTYTEIECDVADRGAAARAGGYFSQEVEGIGGVVKKKIKKKVLVGHVVDVFEGERERGRYLEREQDGLERSWCSWCERIVPSEKDVFGV